MERLDAIAVLYLTKGCGVHQCKKSAAGKQEVIGMWFAGLAGVIPTEEVEWFALGGNDNQMV